MARHKNQQSIQVVELIPHRVYPAPTPQQRITIRPSRAAKWDPVAEPGSRMYELEQLAKPFLLAGAGLDNTKELCFGGDEGLLCLNDALPSSDFCEDHKHQPPLPKILAPVRGPYRDGKGKLHNV